MSKHLIKKLVWSVVAVVLVAGATCGALWLINNRKVSIAETEEPTNEQMEQYFQEYAEKTAQNDPENMLIVMSEGRPETYGAVDVVEAPGHTYYLMYGSAEARDEAYDKLQQDNLVSVEKNTKMELLDYNSWGMAAMGLGNAREELGYGGEPVTVAIIDTGLDMDLFHLWYPDIRVSTYDVATDSSYTEVTDLIGHGTHVAGIVAEGMPKNGSLYIMKATRGSNDELYSADVTTALRRAYYNSTKVVNMSLGSHEQIESQRSAIEDLKSSKIITVAAAGNDGTSETLYPAGYDNTLSVSAINSDLSFASYSNYGNKIDFAAPGTSILSINGNMNGTSMASPHVASAVAILKSYNRNLSFEQTKTLLQGHVRDLGEPGWDERFGYGMIDFNGAEFCELDEYCDEYGVFKSSAPVYARMEIDNITLTPVNYYSISNLMLTEVKLYTDATNYVTKKLQDVHDLTITGYSPETYGLQTVRIACEGVSATVYVVNPDNYTPGWEYRLNDNDEVLLTRYYDVRDYDDENYETSLKKLYIPEQINGKNVVELSETERTYNWGENDEYTSTTIDTVFERSSYADDYLEEVYLPDTMTRIADETFEWFDYLRKVVLPTDGIILGKSVFESADRLKVVEGRIIEMGESAFKGTGMLESIELSEGMTTIPDYAFQGCYSLTSIDIPSTVTEIGRGAFENTRSLGQIILHGNNLRVIGASAFRNARSLTSFTLPVGLAEIQSGAFAGTSLTSISIPASVTKIESGAFSYNDNFATVTVDSGNQKYYDVDGKALMYDLYSSKILMVGTRGMTIPEGTTEIASDTFAGFLAVGRLVIPDSVTYIGSRAFYGCLGLTEVFIPRLDDYGDLYRVFEYSKRSDYGYMDDAPMDVKLRVYNNNLAYEYAVERGFNYQTIDASYARVVEPFEAGDVLTGETEVEFYQDYGTREGGEFTNHTGTDGVKTVIPVEGLVSTEYAGEVERFRLGDTYFNATYRDDLAKEATMRVAVTVNGEYPDYTIPTGITTKLRTSIRDVELPEGFSWMEDSTYFWELGEFECMAMYTPEDTTAYAPIENIPVMVTVIPGREKLPEPVITVDSKVYDGEWDIDLSLIHVTIEGLSADDYSVYGYAYSPEVGTTTAYVSISLDYEVAEEYGFGDDYDEYYNYYVYDYEILPAPEDELEVDDRTEGLAMVVTLEDGIKVTAERACTVIVTYDEGETYMRVPAVAVEGEENTYKFEFEITASTKALLVLRGDGNMDGRLSIADSNMINKSKVSPTLEMIYRPLSKLEELILDLNNSGTISIADSTLINRSLVSPSLDGVYQAISW